MRILSFSSVRSSMWVAIAAIATMIMLLYVAPQVGASEIGEACNNTSSSLICDARGENIAEDGFAENLTNLLLFILGIGAVIMIVIGGIKYATANGDASKISSAKNTILYSVVGLIVALMAWGIIRFVIEQFS